MWSGIWSGLTSLSQVNPHLTPLRLALRLALNWLTNHGVIWKSISRRVEINTNTVLTTEGQEDGESSGSKPESGHCCQKKFCQGHVSWRARITRLRIELGVELIR